MSYCMLSAFSLINVYYYGYDVDFHTIFHYILGATINIQNWARGASRRDEMSLEDVRKQTIDSLSLKDTNANPALLGLLGFGMTTVLLNLHNIST